MTPDEQFQVCLFQFRQGNIAAAEGLCGELLEGAPRHFGALQLLGTLALQKGEFQRAAELIARAIQSDPKVPAAYNNLGCALWKLNRLDEAIQKLNRAIAIDRTYAEAYNNRGNVRRDLKQLAEALEDYDKTIALRPDHANAHLNRGIVLRQLNRFDEALRCYDAAISLRPDHAGAFSSRGNVLTDLRRLPEAIQSCDRAIALSPNYAEAYCNKGNALREIGRLDEALDCYDRALALKFDLAEVHYNRGNVLQALSRLDEAVASYESAIELNPDLDFLSGQHLQAKLKLCNWSGFDVALERIVAKVDRGEKAVGPFWFFAMADGPQLHRKASQAWRIAKVAVGADAAPLLDRASSRMEQKIRVGYFTADFCEHPTAYLTAELFELHDKSRFESIAFYFGPKNGGRIQDRLRAAFNEFIDVRELDDERVARLSRDKGIDIAVDLMGYTQLSRPNIFSRRAAPIQVNYLGFPGTMSADFIDYIVADEILIPEASRRFYSEKIVYMPGSYQVNDRKRHIAEKSFTRAELGLPDQAFVYCCFNNNYKILPQTFSRWMRILSAVEGSVLWLLEDNARVVANLRREAASRGVDPGRLVFGPRIPLDEHMARHRAADLFLDTLPYNAHTTASDALWMGVPVLTCQGQAFAGRVAASLLSAMDMSELIKESADDYEAEAIALARDAERLGAIKKKLERNRSRTRLFDTTAFARSLENAYRQMADRYRAGQRPDHLFPD